MTLDLEIIAPTIGTNSVRCDHCSNIAEFIQVDYYRRHSAQQHQVLCSKCLNHRNELTRCPCCDISEPLEAVNDDGTEVLLMPAYNPIDLDRDGCCSEHP